MLLKLAQTILISSLNYLFLIITVYDNNFFIYILKIYLMYVMVVTLVMFILMASVWNFKNSSEVVGELCFASIGNVIDFNNFMGFWNVVYVLSD